MVGRGELAGSKVWRKFIEEIFFRVATLHAISISDFTSRIFSISSTLDTLEPSHVRLIQQFLLEFAYSFIFIF